MIQPTRPRRMLWHTLAVGLVAFVWQLPFFDRWMSPMDEGHMLAFADMLSKGGELYRDASLLPLPGAFYLLEAAFELFGPSIRLARWIVVFEFSLLTVVAFSLLRRIVPPAVAWGGVAALLLYRVWAFPHWHMYSYSTTGLLALACGLLALVWFLESGRRWALALAGLATGLGVLCKQDYGAAGWLAMNLVLVLAVVSQRPTGRARLPGALAWYNVPGMAVGAWLAVHFLRQGLFLEMLRQTVLNHLIGITTFQYTSLPPIFPLFEQESLLRGRFGFTVYSPAILSTVAWERISSSSWYQHTFLWDLGIKLAFYTPYLLAVVAVLRLWWTRRRLRDETARDSYLAEMALSIFAVALLASFNKPVDWIHLWVLCWPLVCLAIVYAYALWRWSRGGRLLLAIGLLPALALGGYTLQLAWMLRTTFSQPLRLDRAGIFVRPYQDRLFREAVGYVKKHSQPHEPFAVLPYLPVVSFLADRPSPHRAAYILWPVEDVPEREREIAQRLETLGSSHLIYYVSQWVQFPRMEDFAPDLFGYLVENYDIDRVFRSPCWGDVLVGLQRVHRERAGRPLLGPDGSGGKLRIEIPGQPALVPTESERPGFLRPRRVPFRDVIAVEPSVCGRQVVLTVPIVAGERSRLHTAVGLSPDDWCTEPARPVKFEIRARVDGEPATLYSRTLDPLRRYTDRGWFEVDLPLSEYAGQHLELEFATGCEGESSEVVSLGAWDPPRLLEPDRERSSTRSPDGDLAIERDHGEQRPPPGSSLR